VDAVRSGRGGWGERRSRRSRAAPPAVVASVPGLTLETKLEHAIATDPELQQGLAWGRPRAGHPEGTVGVHVADLLETIERWGESGARRADLRLVALVHDALKFRVRGWLPKTGENHHAMRARRLAERYTDDERLLATIELHDRPFAIWRRRRCLGRPDESALDRMLERIPDHELFLRFVELDGSTDGKYAEPIDWLRHELRHRRCIS
jgi:hypothetical protein